MLTFFSLFLFRFFNEFLISNERHTAREIRDEYVDTMSKVYFSYFKGYLSRLMKLQYEEVPDKDDLMAVEDTARKDILFHGKDFFLLFFKCYFSENVINGKPSEHKTGQIHTRNVQITWIFALSQFTPW